MRAVSAVEISSKLGLIIECQVLIVIYFLEEMGPVIKIVRNFFFFTIQPMSVEFAALVVVDVLEGFVLVDVSKNFAFIVSDMLNVKFSQTIGSLVLLDVFLLH